MDMVLVRQTGRDGFDRMPWTSDGKALWAYIEKRSPILLTAVRDERFGRIAEEKLVWINRELGAGVPVIFAPKSRGKGPFARAGDVLIDDSKTHCSDWENGGGLAVLHRSALDTIDKLGRLGL